jgi:polysaccharide biosynthesis protein PslG
MESHRRGSLVLRLGTAAAFASLFFAGATAARAAELEPARMLESATFEDGLGGWRGHRATVRVVRGGFGARSARVDIKRRAATFAIYRRLALTGLTGGRLYRASGWVRGARRGQRLCLRIHEVVEGLDVGGTTACIRSTGRWQRFPAMTHRMGRDRSALRVAVFKPRTGRGNTFWVDRIVLRQARGATPQPKPSPRPGIGTQFHCTWDHYSNAERDAVLDKLKAAGVEWVRIDIGWASLERPAKDTWESWYLKKVDYCIEAARARGINVLGTFWRTPAWANGGQAPEVPPTSVADYADAARWIAARYQGRVAAWEVWNEPDPYQPFWRGTPAQYVSLLKAAYPALKEGDPNALVLLAGPSSNDDGWIRQMYSLGAKGSFDVLGTHPYQGVADAPPEATDDGNRWWFTHLPAVRNVMVEYGDAAKPIWFTEFGWSAHANWAGVENWRRGVTPEQQGEYFVRAVEHTRANYEYVPVMFWYKERAYPGGADPHLEGYALLNADGSERPVYGRLKRYLAIS